MTGNVRRLFIWLGVGIISSLVLSACSPLGKGAQNSATSPGDGGVTPSPRVPQSFGTPIKLSGSMLSTGTGVSASNVAITASGTQVVFMAQKTTAGVDDLWIVNKDGSGLMKLSQGENAIFFKLLSSSVVYIAQQGGGAQELYQVNLDGTNTRKLSGTLVSGGNVVQLDVSEDEAYAVFMADADIQGVVELYSVSLSGMNSTPQITASRVKLHAALASGNSVSEFKLLQPSSGLALIRGSLTTPGISELYSAAYNVSSSPTPVKVSAAATGSGAGVIGFASDLTGANVVYNGDLITQGTVELFYTNGTAAGGIRKLNQSLPAGGKITQFALTPSGDNVVYMGTIDSTAQTVLYQTPCTASSPVLLSPSLVAGGNVTGFSVFPQITSSSGTTAAVAFTADATLAGQISLFMTNDLNAVGHQVSGSMNPFGSVSQFSPSPDGSHLAYIADEDTYGVYNLYVGSMTATSVNLVAPSSTGENLYAPAAYAASGKQIFFIADLGKPHQRNLYLMAETADSTIVILSAATAADSHVYNYLESPNGTWVLYVGDQETSGVNELYMANLPAP